MGKSRWSYVQIRDCLSRFLRNEEFRRKYEDEYMEDPSNLMDRLVRVNRRDRKSIGAFEQRLADVAAGVGESVMTLYWSAGGLIAIGSGFIDLYRFEGVYGTWGDDPIYSGLHRTLDDALNSEIFEGSVPSVSVYSDVLSERRLKRVARRMAGWGAEVSINSKDYVARGSRLMAVKGDA